MAGTATRQDETLPITSDAQASWTLGSTPAGFASGDKIPAVGLLDESYPDRHVSPDGVSTVSPNIGQLALSTTATLVRSATAARQLCTVRNMDSTISIYIGTTSGVTSSTGFLLKAGDALDIKSTTAIYAIAASGTPTCCYYEEVSQ